MEENTNPSVHQEGTITDIDGNIYKTVKIGTQIWMAENLKVTHYRNGEPIPNIVDLEEWCKLNTGGYCNYRNNEKSALTKGRLYNWYAVVDKRNISPYGWHIPTFDEWIILENYLGGWQESNEKIKASGILKNIQERMNSGFNGLPYQQRNGNGKFNYIGTIGYWWSSTDYSMMYAWGRILDYSDSSVNHYREKKICGLSVRCLKN